jgi:hypothetical protein
LAAGGVPVAAFRNIRKAVQHGYTNFDALFKDTILNTLEETSEWKSILDQIHQQ